MYKKITILYGTETGNAEACAYNLQADIKKINTEASVQDMGDYDTSQLVNEDFLIVISSTCGDGNLPDNAEDFYDYLRRNRPDLKKVHFAVCGLGDSIYPNFAQAGKDFDKILEELGAFRVMERTDCDVVFDIQFEEFKNRVLQHLQKK